MSDEPARLEAEWVEEGFMQPAMKKITFQCPVCEHVWTRTYKAEPLNDPPCPNKHCADKRTLADLQQQVANLTRMLELGQAPAQIGNNHRNRAIDTTAEIVMADHKLTDLKDSIRPGESMAPKLPVPMQKAADNFFSGGASTAIGTGQPVTRRTKMLQAMGARALAGGYRDASVAPNQVLPKQRPSVVQVSNDAYRGKR